MLAGRARGEREDELPGQLGPERHVQPLAGGRRVRIEVGAMSGQQIQSCQPLRLRQLRTHPACSIDPGAALA